MLKNLSFFFIFLSISNRSYTQYERFVYTDSFVVVGISPVSAEIIKSKKIREIAAYVINKKDSSLSKIYLYDSFGNLLKETMYVRNSIVTTDSSVYDSKNRRILEFGMWGKGEIFLQNQSTYLGDSIKKCVIIVKRNSWNKEMDTTYKTEYFNNKNQLVELSVLSSLNKSLYHNQYFYSEGGLVEKIKVITNEGSNNKYEIKYENQFLRKGRKMILWELNGSNKIKTKECSYNKDKQCIQCIWFAKPENYTHTFSYLPDGTLHEYKEESYNRWNNQWKTVVYRVSIQPIPL